jgi:hypothetical protein
MKTILLALRRLFCPATNRRPLAVRPPVKNDLRELPAIIPPGSLAGTLRRVA